MVVTIKVAVLGHDHVGKTFLCEKLVNKLEGPSYKSTIGASFYSCDLNYPDFGPCKLQLWDTAGNDRYVSLVPMYLRGSAVTLLLYDITKRSSLEMLVEYQKYITEINAAAQKQNQANGEDLSKNKIQVLLIAVDNPHKTGYTGIVEVSDEEGSNFAISNGYAFTTLNTVNWGNLESITHMISRVAHGGFLTDELSTGGGTIDQHLDVDNEDVEHSPNKNQGKGGCHIM